MTKWAFLVGISEYEHERFNNLEFADRHMSELAQILKLSDEYEDIIELSTNNPPEDQPLRNRIMSKFNILLKRIKPKDTLFIYFVCHGGSYREKNLIFPQNADKSDADILYDTSISINWFLARLRKYEPEAWNVFFIIDACREQLDKSLGVGELDDSFHIKSYENLDNYPAGISFLFSCDSKQKAWSFNLNKQIHSVFSYTLLKGLGGGINPPISFGDLVNYTKTEVNKIIKQKGHPNQTPRDQSPKEAYDIILLELESELIKKTEDYFNPYKMSSLINEHLNSPTKNSLSQIKQAIFTHGNPAVEYMLSFYRAGNEDMKNVSGAILDEWNPDWAKSYEQRYVPEHIPPQSVASSTVAKIYALRGNASSKIYSLVNLIENYNRIKNKPDREIRFVKVIGTILDENHAILQNLGFRILYNGDTIKDENFSIHLTRSVPNGPIHQFLIRRLDTGSIINPDEVYFSFGYPEYLKENNDLTVIADFIKYLTSKLQYSKEEKYRGSGYNSELPDDEEFEDSDEYEEDDIDKSPKLNLINE